jgi:hypothetical protein
MAAPLQRLFAGTPMPDLALPEADVAEPAA